MSDPFNTPALIEMLQSLSLPRWEATLTKAVATDLAHMPAGPDSQCATRFGKGLLYWRIRPEIFVNQTFTNKHYHAAGAHYDALVDKKFDGDGNWLRISAYARLSRSEPATEPVHSVITAIDALHSARRT